MTKLLKHLALRSLQSLGVPAFFRHRNRRRPAVLMFHGFTNERHQALENCQHKHLDVARFESFLQYLKGRFQILSLSELVTRLQAGADVPPSCVVLTFDDGFLSNYTLAFPLLQKYQVPATIFIATEFVDEKKPIWVDRIDFTLNAAGRSKEELVRVKKAIKSLEPLALLAAVDEVEREAGFRLESVSSDQVPAIYRALDWAHVREMVATGLVEIGAHTHKHFILGHCPPEIVHAEVEKSKTIIERETGAPCVHFCYPNGFSGDFSAMTEEIIWNLGFRSTVTTVGGFNAPDSSPNLLKRLGVTNDLDFAQFDLLMSGMDRNQR
jgi:peptidoglycan/xylan/chitin deacetylase (PgdA/CDA1 family)